MAREDVVQSSDDLRVPKPFVGPRSVEVGMVVAIGVVGVGDLGIVDPAGEREFAEVRTAVKELAVECCCYMNVRPRRDRKVCVDTYGWYLAFFSRSSHPGSQGVAGHARPER